MTTMTPFEERVLALLEQHLAAQDEKLERLAVAQEKLANASGWTPSTIIAALGLLILAINAINLFWPQGQWAGVLYAKFWPVEDRAARLAKAIDDAKLKLEAERAAEEKFEREEDDRWFSEEQQKVMPSPSIPVLQPPQTPVFQTPMQSPSLPPQPRTPQRPRRRYPPLEG